VTASAKRRRRATIVAACVAVVTVMAAAGLAVAGGMTIYNSTESTDSAEVTPERVFPDTPTGLVAAVDGAGQLTSMAVVVRAPSGTGGSIVTIPVSADASGGNGTERLPVDEAFALEGAERLEREVEITLSLALDAVEVVTAERLTAMLSGVGPIEVDLPVAVTDAQGEVVAEAGPQTLDAAQAAAVLTARDPARTVAEQYPATSAVWAGVADAVGDGVEAGLDGSGAVDAVMGPVLGGPLGQRSVAMTAPESVANPRGVDVVALDRTELALVFGQVAPGRMSAPSPALTFRIESPFDEVAVGEGGSTAQVAYDAIAQVLFVRGNVLSVSTAAGEVPEVTQVMVSDDSLLGEVPGLDTLLGPVEISVADEPIAGIDAVIRLGTSFLDERAGDG